MKTFYILCPLWVVGIISLAEAAKIPPSFDLYVGAGLVGVALSFPQLQAAARVSSVSPPARKTRVPSAARSDE